MAASSSVSSAAAVSASHTAVTGSTKAAADVSGNSSAHVAGLFTSLLAALGAQPTSAAAPAPARTSVAVAAASSTHNTSAAWASTNANDGSVARGTTAASESDVLAPARDGVTHSAAPLPTVPDDSMLVHVGLAVSCVASSLCDRSARMDSKEGEWQSHMGSGSSVAPKARTAAAFAESVLVAFSETV